MHLELAEDCWDWRMQPYRAWATPPLWIAETGECSFQYPHLDE